MSADSFPAVQITPRLQNMRIHDINGETDKNIIKTQRNRTNEKIPVGG